MKEAKNNIKVSDLRGILEYVRLYRDQIFVLSIDGSVIASPSFKNLVADIAVLKSLGINLVIVHGIGRQLKDAAHRAKIKPSDIYGQNPVDDATMALAREVSVRVTQTVVDALAGQSLRCVTTNAVRATEVGIISGVNYMNAGKIDRVDFRALENLLSLGMIPVLSPCAADRNGKVFRIDSDLLAAKLASGLGATKLIFLTETRGLMTGREKALAIPVGAVDKIVAERRAEVDPRVLSKVNSALEALDGARTQRAHILDGTQFACLLTELFDKVGCGTMIYADQYQSIRRAKPEDIDLIYNLTRMSSKSQNLVYRDREEVAKNIDFYYVYEMDGSIIAFVSLLDIGGGCAELASLHVQPFYQGHGVGRRMVEFIRALAKKEGYKKLFTLSTKSAPFFEVCGFKAAKPASLPKGRLAKYEASGRNSKVFCVSFESGARKRGR